MEELNNVTEVTGDDIVSFNEETGEIYDLDTTDEETTEGGTTNKLAVAGIIAGVIAGGVAVYKNRKKIAKKWRDKRRDAMLKKLAKYDELDQKYLEENKQDDDFEDDFFKEDGEQPKTEGNNTEPDSTQQVEKENPTPKKGK